MREGPPFSHDENLYKNLRSQVSLFLQKSLPLSTTFSVTSRLSFYLCTTSATGLPHMCGVPPITNKSATLPKTQLISPCRVLYVIFKNERSPSHPLVSRTPEGLILEPMVLFSITVNEIPHPEQVLLAKYADDATVNFRAPDLPNLKFRRQL